MRRLLLLVSGFLVGFIGAGRARSSDAFIDEYMLGWRVRIKLDFQRAQPRQVEQALALLRTELAAIAASVPPQRLPPLRRAVFWLDERVPEGAESAKAPVFHPDRTWLAQHGLDPEMAGGIELPNAQTFIDSYAWEPWAVLHELAHFYHHAVLGDGDPLILETYRRALAAHLYEQVPHYDGKTVRAYALENEREYFAELTEAYFGRNDFFPFTRAELETYDPAGFAMMRQVWEAP